MSGLVIDEELLLKAIARWEKSAQWGMVIEECAELIAAINQNNRGRVNTVEVAGEIADVLIMAHQARLMIGPGLVDEMLAWKMARLEMRVMEG